MALKLGWNNLSLTMYEGIVQRNMNYYLMKNLSKERENENTLSLEFLYRSIVYAPMEKIMIVVNEALEELLLL